MNAQANLVSEPTRRRLTVDDFHRMGEAGLFAADERVELVEGEIVTMPPIGWNHAGRTNALLNHFTVRIAGKAWALCQNPVCLNAGTEVYPDFALVKLPASRYQNRHPEPYDVLLVAEVAQSSLAYDQGTKRRLYAEAALPEYWLVDAEKQRVIRYAEPTDGEFLRVELLTGMAAPLLLPECTIDIGKLFVPD